MGIDEPGIYSLTARIHHLARLISAHDVLVGTHSQDLPIPHRKCRRLAESAVDSIDQAMMQDLPVLEDHDVLQNFEPLKDLPAPVQSEDVSDSQHM